MKYSIECEREEDGRWLAEVPELPGVMAYGSTPEEAQAKAQVLADATSTRGVSGSSSRCSPTSDTLMA
jgi:predicted RNase H-like HicB family nuclease